jgi:ribonuclease HI
LKKAAEKIFQKGNENCIQFDPDKTELIHFHKTRNSNDSQLGIKFPNFEVKPKLCVKWLGMYLDSKLNFKTHVEKRINEATQIFYQITRLSNTEKGLSFQAMKQLYMACITTIADYGVQIWWNGQKNLLDKFQKMQNSAIRKIAGAFKTAPIQALELETAIPPPEIRFQKLCNNYAIRLMHLNQFHPTVQRLPPTFPPYCGKFSANINKYLDWNQKDINAENPINSRILRPRTNINTAIETTKKKPIKSQLFRIIEKIKDFSNFKNVEKNGHQCNTALNTLELGKFATVNIATKEKDVETKEHLQKIENLNESNLIIYTDGSKGENENTGASIYCLKTNYYENWNLGKECENWDGELFAIAKALKFAKHNIQPHHQKIWIFSDSQACLKRLQKNTNSTGQYLVTNISKNCRDIKNNFLNLEIIFEWIPAHKKIPGNEKADLYAKLATNNEQCNEAFTSFSYLKKASRKITLNNWKRKTEMSDLGKSYKKFSSTPKWKINTKIGKKIWSTYIQLKTGHGYFNSYLINIPDSEIQEKRCFCNRFSIQNPTHLLLECKKYITERKEMFKNIQSNDQKTLVYLFNTNEGKKKLFEFLEKTNIATRQWKLHQ